MYMYIYIYIYIYTYTYTYIYTACTFPHAGPGAASLALARPRHARAALGKLPRPPHQATAPLLPAQIGLLPAQIGVRGLLVGGAWRRRNRNVRPVGRGRRVARAEERDATGGGGGATYGANGHGASFRGIRKGR